MELYTEQLFRKHKTLLDWVLQIGILLACFLGAAALIFFCGMLSSMGSALGMLLALILIYAAYKYQWFQRFDKEFEYLYFNGDLDVDCIIAKSSRKRILSIKASNVIRFGIYKDSVKTNVPFDKVVDVTSGYETENPVCFLVSKERNVGTVLLIFEPKKEILEHMKRKVKIPFEE